MQSSIPRHQNGSTFCVVPIIAANDQALPATFDFWAAGKDCCGETGAGFACGAAKSAVARGGLRRGVGSDGSAGSGGWFDKHFLKGGGDET